MVKGCRASTSCEKRRNTWTITRQLEVSLTSYPGTGRGPGCKAIGCHQLPVACCVMLECGAHRYLPLWLGQWTSHHSYWGQWAAPQGTWSQWFAGRVHGKVKKKSYRECAIIIGNSYNIIIVHPLWSILSLTRTSKKADPNVCHRAMYFRKLILASSEERAWWRLKLATMACGNTIAAAAAGRWRVWTIT